MEARKSTNGMRPSIWLFLGVSLWLAQVAWSHHERADLQAQIGTLKVENADLKSEDPVCAWTKKTLEDLAKRGAAGEAGP
jgi:hypothetical protein